MRALVLGGGGPVGIAWEAGVLAGLADAGVDLAAADRIIGTSAGSFVGAHIAGGRSASNLAAAQIKAGRATKTDEASPAPRANLEGLQRIYARFPMDREPPLELRRELGAFARTAQTAPEEDYVASFGGLCAPERTFPPQFACTAVDIESGEFRLFTARDHAPLGLAVAASCSVPGVFAPVTIQGRRYMDGGMRSGANIDQAAGARAVVALVVKTAQTAAFMSAAVDREVAAVKASGGICAILTPDAQALETFGPNLMHAARRADICEAGIAQGRRQAARIADLWAQTQTPSCAIDEVGSR